MMQRELQVIATELAELETQYRSWCERYVDKLSVDDRYQVRASLSSIAASAAHLTCALINRES